MTGRLRRLGVAALVSPFLLLSVFAGAAHAADSDATIDHSEVTDGQLRLLVSVPGTDTIDLDSVKVTLDSDAVDATATDAGASDEVSRTTVLAIDTSNSMKGARITAAKQAALTYLDTVPANVLVGIVTFDNDVTVRQDPSLDRDASKDVVNSLQLKLNTALYSGVTTAVQTAAKNEGQHQVLVLSDGQDSTGTPLLPLTNAIKKSGVKVDVVALDQGSAAPQPLAIMAAAGKGTVVSASAEALTEAFTSEADALARQVLVTVKVPETQNSTDASVAISLTAGDTPHTVSAFVTVKDQAAAAAAALDIPQSNGSSLSIPNPVLYGAIAAIGVGLLGVVAALAMGGTPSRETDLAHQLQFYTAKPGDAPMGRAGVKAGQAQSSSLSEQARQAAANVLASNTSTEARITHRLEGAGMALKSAEWLLIHLGIAFGSGILGLLISGGNPLVLIITFAIGLVGPWIYLAYKRTQRLKAFDSGLADTLQLMSGSLSAGLSLAQSMDTIVREGTEPITSEFKRVIVETRLGVGLEDALEGVALRMESKDFQWVVMAIRIQREVGGNLAELLLTVAATLREREYIRRHVSALSAEGRLSCWILGALPPGFMLYLTVTRPDYVEPLFTTGLGILMCITMAVLLTVGIFWMSKVAKVEV